MEAYKPPALMACTLSAVDFKGRAQWRNKITRDALIAHQVDGPRARLIYHIDATEDLEKLARQEQQCCSFLMFDLVRTCRRQMELTITAPGNAGDDAKALFAHLLPS